MAGDSQCTLGKTLDFWEIIMQVIEFQSQPREDILYRTTSNHQWYVIIWKITSGAACITIFTFLINSLLAVPINSVLMSILPDWAASLVTKFLYLGLFPLSASAWITDDIAGAFTGEFILTNQRIWIRGSPHAWSQSETQQKDIASVTCRRDAIFIKLKSDKKIQVHMFADAKLFMLAFKRFIEKPKTR
jgi:hypothetical protein